MIYIIKHPCLDYMVAFNILPLNYWWTRAYEELRQIEKGCVEPHNFISCLPLNGFTACYEKVFLHEIYKVFENNIGVNLLKCAMTHNLLQHKVAESSVDS